MKISVLCVCYNHEAYISDAINGILNQKVNIPIELIIYDDLSTDSSRDIIDSIIDSYNGDVEIKKVYAEENQYSQGIMTMFLLLPYVEGDFIAFCEGDDYWTDELKLEKQYNLLLDSSMNICCHPALTLYNGNIEDKGYGYHGKDIKELSYKKIVKSKGGIMPMASIFIRSQPLLDFANEEPVFLKKHFYHSVIQIVVARDNGALYLPDKMSVYRSMHEGSWSFQQSTNYKLREKQFQDFKERMFFFMNKYKSRHFLLFFSLYLKRLLKSYKNKIRTGKMF
ncbi:glycosyltransferase family 2 protein [Vibrio celticus]|uniref:Putative glycosyl transferase n=1 Tax=Vibrio celticus TaxID=446372 RepID=A0A1C3JC22_9VIBR|nr:glycosyltransferase [Vibrio celticus]SBT12665.1 putative glycosyl transferase [Vibrio celticus]